MGLADIAIGALLLFFLVVMTLIISPPEKWSRKWMGHKDDK
jgi:hypothetical protein